MNSLLELRKESEKIVFPKYLESKIQAIAIAHLGVKDMGKLRDAYEGQSYYDRIRIELIVEYCFEKLMGWNFDWSIRENKNFRRLEYEIDEMRFNLLPISKNYSSIITSDIKYPLVIGYFKPENHCFISGLIPVELVKEYQEQGVQSRIDFLNTNIFQSSGIFLKFSNLEELKANLLKINATKN